NTTPKTTVLARTSRITLATMRFDHRYWQPLIRAEIDKLRSMAGAQTIKEINTISTRRGKSPPVGEYVSAKEGYALVVKSGSNISKKGKLLVRGDYIEKPYFEREYLKKKLALHDGDILLSSTGDGTLGKCCAYRNRGEDGKTLPGVPEGHVTIIRVNQKEIYPEYLCDYLRKGFGHDQLYRSFTGTTGMVEIAVKEVDQIVVPPLPARDEQKKISQRLRKAEFHAEKMVAKASERLTAEESLFRSTTLNVGENE
ncbi:MAG: hypothetical protein KY475_24985, partial [Planctomycetes bacterium]|nr:hypothetical protein [Planctomycetota bacterium]